MIYNNDRSNQYVNREQAKAIAVSVNYEQKQNSLNQSQIITLFTGVLVLISLIAN